MKDPTIKNAIKSSFRAGELAACIPTTIIGIRTFDPGTTWSRATIDFPTHEIMNATDLRCPVTTTINVLAVILSSLRLPLWRAATIALDHIPHQH